MQYELYLVACVRFSGIHSFVSGERVKWLLAQEGGSDYRYQHYVPTKMSNDLFHSANSFTCIVGGMYYTLLRSDVEAHPNCYFASAIKDVWNESNDPIVINRDGVLFQHIYGYMYNCRYNVAFVVKGSLELLLCVRREADYYNFPELFALYDKACMEELQKWCKLQATTGQCPAHSMSTQAEVVSELEKLVNTELYPGCDSGILEVTHCKPRISQTFDLEYVKLNSVPVIDDSGDNTMKNAFYVYDLMNLNALLDDLREVLPTLPGVDCFLDVGHAFAFTKGGYIRSDPIGVLCANRIGTMIYILNSPHTGGTITVTSNGVSTSITKPGEYIMYTNDHTRDIGLVTSGALMYAKFEIVRKDIKPVEYFGILRQPTLIPYHTFPSQNALICAVHSELSLTCGIRTAGVVLCLSTLYPIVGFDPTGPYLETDPDSLQDRDAMLFEYLKGSFSVILVVVYVQRCGDASKGSIIGTDPAIVPVSTNIKIIAPFHNFKESFLARGSSFATLYTAMYISKK